jgi:hypothetical protein
MNKSIAIVTDFTVESLALLQQAMHVNAVNPVDLYLIHGYRAADSIVDLLFYSKKDDLEKLLTGDFSKALEIIRNGYASRINSIQIELVSGFTSAAVNHFLEAHQISEVYVPRHPFRHIHERSFDLLPLLKHAGVLLIEVDWPQARHTHNKTSLAQIFLFESTQ